MFSRNLVNQVYNLFDFINFFYVKKKTYKIFEKKIFTTQTIFNKVLYKLKNNFFLSTYWTVHNWIKNVKNDLKKSKVPEKVKNVK